ncbi:MAG: class I SAM-dependent methyltransferase [Candidatus Bathyarchaeia archaeon]
MRSQVKTVFFERYVFHVWPEVYEPAEDSFLFAENLTCNAGDTVLDVGTGCGILAIVAAAKASHVLALDINPFAVRCAKENAKLNHVSDKMLFLQGNLFAPLKNTVKFDLILFNAPYLPVKHEKADLGLERAWAGGKRGRQLIDSFIYTSPLHLKMGGRVLLLQSSLSGIEETLRGFETLGLKAKVVAEQSLPFFESIALIEAMKNSATRN